MKMTTIDLMRHGEPVGGRRYRGQIDDPLSDRGWRQMREAVGDHCPWEAVVSSPLSRCRAFADELAKKHGLPVTYDERLMEIGFGAWEGKTADEISAVDPDSLARFYADPITHRPEGAELLSDFDARIAAGLSDILEIHEGQHIIVVGHAGMMRMVLRHALGMPVANIFRISIPNAGLTRLEYYRHEGDFHARLLFHAGSLS